MQKEKEMILEMTGQIMNQKGKDEFYEKPPLESLKTPWNWSFENLLFRSRRDESSHSDHNNYGRRDRYDSQDYRQMDDQVSFTFSVCFKQIACRILRKI